jgi:hypothetical protein
VTRHDEREDYDDEPWRGRLTAEQVVKPPADWLWSCGMFQLGASLCLAGFFGSVLLQRVWERQPIRPLDLNAIFIWLPTALAGVAAAKIVLRGSAAMRQLRRYPWAMAAAVLTTLSVPCILALPYGAPVGIWALAVLLRPDVRARFEATDRGTINESRPRPD